MIVRRLLLTDFLRYKDATIDLPEVGLVAFCGLNGSGKSSCLEAIAWTLWGRSLRGADDPGPAGSALLSLDDGLQVERQRAGRVTKGLTLSTAAESLSGQTVTQTQAKIVERWGTFERFAATRVFGRDLLSRFGTATNKERQQLLESILGFEQFSRAEKLARAELSTRRSAQDGADSALRYAEKVLQDAQERAQGSGPPPNLLVLQDEIDASLRARQAAEGALAKARAARDRSASLLDRQRRARYDAGHEADQAKAETMVAAGKIQAARKLLECPVCFRGASEEERGVIVAHHQATLNAAAKRKADATNLTEALDADMEDLGAQVAIHDKVIRAADQDRSVASIAYEQAKADLRVAQAANAQAMRAADEIDKADSLVVATSNVAVTARGAVQQAQAAVEALGPRGARLRLFSDALQRLEAETNTVLDRLGMGLAVEISARKTQASGKEVDEVSITLKGAGAGEYLGASGGE
ncbi:MAG TPA: AAA family ATPase, partial [Phenylobacterium sp.]|nr:AAA family ATPase [Phenylobacterium sp.]